MDTNHEHWMASLFASIDRMDAAAFAGHLAPEARFAFGNAPPVTGREAIGQAVAGFFAALGGLRHAIERHWSCGDTLICHGTVTYRRKDGSEVALPFANVMTLAGGLATDYRIYADLTPLFAPAA